MLNLQSAQRANAQRGVAAVEFALVAIVFFTLLLGVAEFGRWVYTLNAASEATRFGARVAVVCDKNDPDIKARMRTFLPQAADGNIVISYSPTDCTVSSCQSVTVSLSGVSIGGLAWFLPSALPIPPFAHTLPRESMLSAIDSDSNPLCN
ncbi:MAG: pilus assembly protein [Burkholderiaceae bacterium]|nr:pilus assembly protein [Burkholderiaceae bacterium]